MGRQQTLPLDGPRSQDALWSRVPEEDRRKAVEILARMLARTVHPESRKENNNDDGNDGYEDPA
jgi:hypothetical protein